MKCLKPLPGLGKDPGNLQARRIFSKATKEFVSALYRKANAYCGPQLAEITVDLESSIDVTEDVRFVI